MADEKKTHTQGEVDLLVAVARVETLQCYMNDSFDDHKKEDDTNFSNLYNADKKILAEINLIPEKMVACSEKIKTETLLVARKEFTPVVKFEVFKTEIVSSIRAGTIVSSVLTPIIISLIYIIYTSLKG